MRPCYRIVMLIIPVLLLMSFACGKASEWICWDADFFDDTGDIESSGIVFQNLETKEIRYFKSDLYLIDDDVVGYQYFARQSDKKDDEFTLWCFDIEKQKMEKTWIQYRIPDLVKVQAFIGDEVFVFVENKDDYFPELVRINRDGQTVPMSLESGPKKAMFGSDIYASDKIATPYEIILGSQRPAISLKNAVESIQEYTLMLPSKHGFPRAWLDDRTVLLLVKKALPLIGGGYGNLILMQYDIDMGDFCILEDADGNQIEIYGDTANVDIAVNRELRQIVIAACQHPMTQDDFMYANCELQYTLYLINLNTGEREVLYETQPKRGMCFGEYSKIRWL